MAAFDTRYPSIDDLRKRAKQRIPRFAFEYLDGGCNEDVNLYKNTVEIRETELRPVYLKDFAPVNLSCSLFGRRYNAPFGIAPVGLQGLMWPGAPQILAKAAKDHNIPFILSTVTTASIEKIAEVAEGNMWFQLYHPAEQEITDDILLRLEAAGVDVLVVLCDVPSFGYRPRDIRNGLSMPPRMTAQNVLQILMRPRWGIETLVHGIPEFETMKRYMPKGLNMKQLGLYMNKTFSGRINAEKLKRLRDRWKGKIIMKGVATSEDAIMCVESDLDGIIVSNHGGRQLDAGQSSIGSLPGILESVRSKLTIMIDSGFQSGPDIARGLASGADFIFLGRTFMYGVAALGKRGGDHTISILKAQLQQVMEQLGCSDIKNLPSYLVQTRN
jgi:L-lactate dehydrogenase (cytochrome)